MRRVLLLLALLALVAGCTEHLAGSKIVLHRTQTQIPQSEPPLELANKIVRSMLPPELRDNVTVTYTGGKTLALHEFSVDFMGETRKLYITESGSMVLFAQEITPEYLQSVEEALRIQTLEIPGEEIPPLNETPQAEPPSASASSSLEDGWYLFYLPTCPHCVRQIQILGDEVSKVRMIDCSTQGELCSRYSIRGTPTWLKIQNGTEVDRLEGVQSLEVLRSKGVL